jgi:hypothetical protein
MAITVRRPNLSWSEKLYLPAILSGMAITFGHLKNMLLGRTSGWHQSFGGVTTLGAFRRKRLLESVIRAAADVYTQTCRGGRAGA